MSERVVCVLYTMAFGGILNKKKYLVGKQLGSETCK